MKTNTNTEVNTGLFSLSLSKKIVVSLVLAIVCWSLALVLGVFYYMEHKNGLTTQVATIDKQTITKSDLSKELDLNYGKSTLDKIISDRLIDMEAKSKNITVSDTEIKSEIDKSISQYGSEENLVKALKAKGSTLDLMKDTIMHYLKMRKLVEPRIKITQAEIEGYFDTSKESLDTPESVMSYHILVNTEQSAKEVEDKFKKGEKFETLAKQYSRDESTASQGGKMGYIVKEQTNPDFAKTAFSIPLNTVSEPVRTNYGYEIIMVTEKKEPVKATLKNSQDRIIQTIKDGKLQFEYNTWIKEMEKKYKVIRK